MSITLSQCWYLVLFEPVQVLCMLPRSSWIQCVSYGVWRMLFPWSHPPPLSLRTFSPPFPYRFLSLEGRGLIKTFYLGWVFQSLLQSHVYCLLVGPYVARRRLSDEGWAVHQPLGINTSLGVALLLCFCSRIIGVDFSLRYTAYLVPGSWLL